MKRTTLSVALTLPFLVARIASASSYMILEKLQSSADYVLPAPLLSAHIEVAGEQLSVRLAGRHVPIDNAWLQAIPGLELHSAVVARAFDDANRVFVLITCARDDAEEPGQVVLEIRNWVVVNRTIDGCASV